MNIWSLSDGSLVYTTTGTGGVNTNGLKWIEGVDSLAIAFSRSKSINLLSYGVEDLKQNLPLATVRCALMKKGVRGEIVSALNLQIFVLLKIEFIDFF